MTCVCTVITWDMLVPTQIGPESPFAMLKTATVLACICFARHLSGLQACTCKAAPRGDVGCVQHQPLSSLHHTLGVAGRHQAHHPGCP